MFALVRVSTITNFRHDCSDHYLMSTIILVNAGKLHLIKGAYSSTETNPEENYHVISTTPLGTGAEVTQMTLHGSGATAYLYIGTENGIYQIPTADCGRLTDCCSCVAARDPYCTYDMHSYECVAVGSTESSQVDLLQDYAKGDSSLCAALATENSSSVPPGANGCDGETAAAETTKQGGDVSTTAFTTYAIGTFWPVLE